MDLSLLPLVFSLILTVASRLLHIFSIDDKTSRLIPPNGGKILHSEGNPEMFAESHGEEKREEGDRRRDQEEKRGNQKERDQSSQ